MNVGDKVCVIYPAREADATGVVLSHEKDEFWNIRIENASKSKSKWLKDGMIVLYRDQDIKII